MAIIIENKFNIGDTVYLLTDQEQIPRIVFAFTVFKSDMIYKLARGTETSEHYEFELSTEINVLSKVK